MSKPAGTLPDPSAAFSDPDAPLLEAVGRGDRDAARQLMARRLPRLLAIAQRLLSDPVEAEDIAQETFIRVWKAAARWRSGEAKVETWMSRIAINLCYDRLRRRREILTDALPERVDGAPGPETALSLGQAARQVHSAVASLPDRQRLALELCHFQEMTNIDAAEAMDISVEALESLLARGRRRLRAVLTGQEDALLAGFGGDLPVHEGTRG
ncbi:MULTISPECIES: RNA polymerase sigma factor [Hyphobacterium]|uniref:RNA polymerase sigma factor n=1 Tax=Hyphobacterium vulgare TaxID=1736751 RepID=A0ABV6ZUR8_9PROT